MKYSPELRAEHKRRVKITISLASSADASFDWETVTMYEISEAMKKAYGKSFNDKYLMTLRDEVLDELYLIVEKLSTSESAMELMQESQERIEMLERIAETLR